MDRSGSNPAQVQTFVSVCATPLISPQAVAGFVQAGMRFQVLDSTGAGTGALSFAAAGGAAYRVRFDEGFANAFRKRNVATTVAAPEALGAQHQFGLDYGTESGVYIPTLGSVNGVGQAGLATQGTRLMTRLRNVPAGVRVYVTATGTGAASGAEKARLVQTDGQGAGAYAATGTAGALFGAGQPAAAEVAIQNGTGWRYGRRRGA